MLENKYVAKNALRVIWAPFPFRYSLQKQLNHELRSVFSNSILFSQNEEESDNFASLNLDELSDPLEADTAEGLNDFPVIDGKIIVSLTW